MACWAAAASNKAKQQSADTNNLSKVLFATSNDYKLLEARAILPGLEWVSLDDFPQLKALDPAETGKTFAANAELKAREYGEASQALTLAEDSGLEVAALGGEPGIHSARWVSGSDEDRYTTMLAKMAGEPDRSAQYVSVLCLYDPQSKQVEFFRGEVKGKIIDEPRGTGGFGYDPVFVPEGENRTFAELAVIDEKHQYSHRRHALDAFHAWWQQQQNG